MCVSNTLPESVWQAFDELLLLKIGGRVIYHGSIGALSCDLRHYFEV